MSNLHRLQWIDARIRAGTYPNAKSLAAEFEISRRQALRDFEYLRDSLGAPLTYDAAHRGYTYTSDAYTLPGPYVTREQRSVLTNLAAYYADVARRDPTAGTVYAGMAALFERLGGRSGGGSPAASPAGAGPAARRPYRAVLRRAPGAGAPSLKPFWRGDLEPGLGVYEFQEVWPFVAAILSSWPPHGVQSPGWLRERLAKHLEQMCKAQTDVTRHVTPPLVSSTRESIQRRPIAMTKRVTLDARFAGNWTSYVGAVEGVLKATGMTDLSTDQLMGLTGMAFHLIVHEQHCISSVTVYDWVTEHADALDRLGILSEVFQAMPESATYDAACRRSVANIKAAIDRGAGVILWGVDTGEFGVVYGYDDEDGVFLVDGVGQCGPGSAPILYENVGRTFPDAPILHYQIPVEKVAFNPDKAYRASLEYYVRHMESPFHMGPSYKAGLLAYDNWIRTLERGDYQSMGLLYNTTVYAHAKRSAANYVRFLAESWHGLPGLDEVAAHFAQIAGLYEKMLKVTGHDLSAGPHAWPPVTKEQAGALLPLVREAKRLDAAAGALVKAGLAATAK